MTIERGELEVPASVEQTTIVLSQPLALGAELLTIARGPEVLQVGGTLRPVPVIELAELTETVVPSLRAIAAVASLLDQTLTAERERSWGQTEAAAR